MVKSLSFIFLALSTLLLQPRSSCAQWESTAQLFGARQNNIGWCLTYKHGNLWAGGTRVYLSTDLGDTWIDRSPQFTGSPVVVDIDFISPTTGVVALNNTTIYKTTDAGLNWQQVFVTSGQFYSIQYMGDEQNIIAGGNPVFVSRDGGTIWQEVAYNGFAAHINYLKGDTVIAFSYNIGNGSAFFFSTDKGETWTQRGNSFDLDSYSIEADSLGNLIVVNEEFWSNWDQMAEILFSSDFGGTWVVTAALPLPSNARRPKFAGNFAAGLCGYYAQTGDRGVVRSTDRGRTWDRIGGPNGLPDNRSMCAVSDDVLFCISDSGKIFRTFNGGGFPIGSSGKMSEALSISALTLFERDTIFTCRDSIRRTLLLDPTGCGIPRISNYSITGSAASAYSLIRRPDAVVNGTIIELQFQPTENGNAPALLTLTFTDGSTTDISLQGTGKGNFEFVAVTMRNTTIDTIGTKTCLPVYVEPHELGRDIRVSVHFDFDLQYTGAFTGNGKPLDIFSPQAPGSATFVIPSSEFQEAEPSAYLCFDNVTSFPRSAYYVTVDSVSSIETNPLCLVQNMNDTSAFIEVMVSCGTQVLSRYLVTDNPLQVNIQNAFARKQLELTSPTEGNYFVQIVDMLGSTHHESQWQSTLDRHIIDYSMLPHGSYFVVLRNAVHHTVYQVLL